MAPGVLMHPHAAGAGHVFPGLLSGSRGVSGLLDNDSISKIGKSYSAAPRRTSMGRSSGAGTTAISNVVSSVRRRSSDEVDTTGLSKLLNTSHATILDWIRTQRMTVLPPEGSDYDRVLAWAQLFIERVNAFGLAVEEFTGDGYSATQLIYGHCALLLDLGKENARALMVTFGFFYNTSMVLVNFLERAEIFSASQEIQEHLVLGLGDLVTLVAAVSTHFHKAIRELTTKSVSVDISLTFPGQIHAFRQRCEKIAESIWRHQFLTENLEGHKVSEVKLIQSWLTSEDPVLRNVVETTTHLAQDREELTCLWLEQYLAKFLKGPSRNLCITGKPGSGKTVLSSVIVDQLQHLIGGVSYKTLFVPVNGRIPAEATPRAIAKTTLRQLLDQRIGNVQLFHILSDAYEHSKVAIKDDDYDKILWNALERALCASLPGAKELVIIVDGVDEASSDEMTLLQRLNDTTNKASNVKLITLHAQAPPAATGRTHVQISDDLIFDDIAVVVRSVLRHSRFSSSMSEMEQEGLTDNITQASNGSFLWAKLAMKYILHESSVQELRKAADTLVRAKLDITDLVLRFIQPSDVTVEAKLMLLWLATADRPLQLKELATLAAIQVDKQVVADSNIDPLHVLRRVSPLVFLQDGYIYLRHGLVRTAILDVFSKGKLVPAIKDQHADLVTRLCIYIKTTVTEQHEPSLTSLGWHDVNRLLNKHPLLEFGIRYWTPNLKKASAFIKGGEAQAAKEFSKVFPASTTVLLLERSIWESIPTPELLSYQTIVTDICRKIFPENNVVTLQSIILLAYLYWKVDHTTEAIPLFYEAATISRTLLTSRHIVTMQMASAFLDLTMEEVTDSKTDIMIKREETLLLLVECFKVHYGSTSENVVSILNQLVEHYHLVKEERKAQATLTSLQSITTDTEHYAVSQDTAENLHVHLIGRDGRGAAETSSTLSLDVKEEDEEISGSNDLDVLMKLAKKYAAEGQIERAESTYVEIWDRASMECRIHYSTLWEKRKMKAILTYTEFLQSQQRHGDASSILFSFWQENKCRTLTESSAFYFQEVAKIMKTVGLSTLSLEVLNRCAEYYQSIDRTQTTTYEEIQQSIQTISTEVMQSISSSALVTSETALEDVVIETTIADVDEKSFTTTRKLIGLYISQNRWSDATRVIKKVLRGIWPSLFTQSLQDVTLPTEQTENCVELAECLSQCYSSRRRLTKERDMRIRTYHAVRSGRNVEDKLRQRITTELLQFFERTSQNDMIINIHQELLNDYTKHYGPEHAIVIKTLWTLAQLTRPRPIFVDYYQQIVQTLNKGSQTSHPEAFEPLLIVATELWNQGRYSDALHHYQVIFTTFMNQPKLNPKLQDQKFIQELFNQYAHCLRAVRTEFDVLHKITVEYRSSCKAVFGATALITLQATLTLAKLCQESKRYEMEAITLYEELLETKSEELDLQEISTTLAAINEEQATAVSSASKEDTITSTQVERAVKVLRKRITSVRENYGWAHQESLSRMEEMVSLYAKNNEIEAVTQELQEATVHILSSEASSNLSAAAAAVASCYIKTGQVQQVTKLSEELYRQAIMKDTSNAKAVNFDVSAKGRQSLIFLAQLEYSLRRHISNITEILASLTAEYVYFEEFRKQVKAKTSTLHSVSVSAARLHQHLITANRPTAAMRVFEDFTNYFLGTEGKRTNLTETAQVNAFLQGILKHFSTHRSQNFIRSIGIMSNNQVVELLKAQKYDMACDLALSSFKYISADDEYRTPAIIKFVFTLGMAISGRNITPRLKLSDATRKKLLGVSETIIHETLGVIKGLNVNLALVGLDRLNSLIGLIGERQDYETLTWLLNMLWNSREPLRTWQPHVTFALGRLLIMASYLAGDSMAALRLAKNIVYNYRRVYGTRATNTLEMSVLLSQLYTTIAQRHLADEDGREQANKYYKKSAALHEHILRIFSDRSFAELEDNLDGTMSMEDPAIELDPSETGKDTVSEGEHVRRHMKLLKLSIQRLGSWPKDYNEYKLLSTDLFREFPTELKAMESVEKWNLKAFGSGKAESNEDLLNEEFKAWRLLD